MCCLVGEGRGCYASRRLYRPAHGRAASGRMDFEHHPVGVVPPVFAECAVRAAGNADGGAAVICSVCEP